MQLSVRAEVLDAMLGKRFSSIFRRTDPVALIVVHSQFAQSVKIRKDRTTRSCVGFIHRAVTSGISLLRPWLLPGPVAPIRPAVISSDACIGPSESRL